MEGGASLSYHGPASPIGLSCSELPGGQHSLGRETSLAHLSRSFHAAFSGPLRPRPALPGKGPRPTSGGGLPAAEGRAQEPWPWRQTTWVPTLTLPLKCCVTAGCIASLCLSFLVCKMVAFLERR